MASADDPFARFRQVFDRAAAEAPFDHTAAALATVTDDGRPTVRVVLVRHADARGLVFFTNYRSRKGRELALRPAGCLNFYWPWIDEQVRIEGPVSTIPAEESDAYFRTRPRGSQIGAWASEQSEPLPSRRELEDRYFALEREYEGRDVPRPPHWGGYRLAPQVMEFWKAGEYRLHDRSVYRLTKHGWTSELLYP